MHLATSGLTGDRTGTAKDPAAFNDMVRSAANIVSEAFGMLGEKDRAAFYARVDRDIAKRETFA